MLSKNSSFIVFLKDKVWFGVGEGDKNFFLSSDFELKTELIIRDEVLFPQRLFPLEITEEKDKSVKEILKDLREFFSEYLPDYPLEHITGAVISILFSEFSLFSCFSFLWFWPYLKKIEKLFYLPLAFLLKKPTIGRLNFLKKEVFLFQQNCHFIYVSNIPEKGFVYPKMEKILPKTEETEKIKKELAILKIKTFLDVREIVLKGLEKSSLACKGFREYFQIDCESINPVSLQKLRTINYCLLKSQNLEDFVSLFRKTSFFDLTDEELSFIFSQKWQWLYPLKKFKRNLKEKKTF